MRSTTRLDPDEGWDLFGNEPHKVARFNRLDTESI